MVEYAYDCRDCQRVILEGNKIDKCDSCGGEEFRYVEIIQVDTGNPYAETWNILDYYSVDETIKKLVVKRLDNNFFNYNLDKLNSKIGDYIGEEQKRNLIDYDDLEDVVNKFLKKLFLAKELFNSSYNVPLSTKPMLLFYGARAMAEALISITFKEEPDMHGLKYPKNKNDIIEIFYGKNNVSALLCDSLTPSAKYIDEYKEVDINDVIYTYSRYSKLTEYYNWMNLPERKRIILPEMFLLYIILYYFSIISRYRPIEWRNTITGKEPNSFINKILLKICSIDFPQKFINAIEDKIFLFRRAAHYSSSKSLWLHGLDF